MHLFCTRFLNKITECLEVNEPCFRVPEAVTRAQQSLHPVLAGTESFPEGLQLSSAAFKLLWTSCTCWISWKGGRASTCGKIRWGHERWRESGTVVIVIINHAYVGFVSPNLQEALSCSLCLHLFRLASSPLHNRALARRWSTAAGCYRIGLEG